ncbi:two-component system, OmpR family, sensor histidine kinase CpxA [Bryocella elongata]|uniref:histidine kinase n=1 Tax=Bryocella elongata TaxID=863522 RepID=A0A1H6BZN0_9BACT|nr:ATP-binding protein [Bryocella elongata]SEG66169.1 two-component system, OmpR family, sensor histidine kinase CpxA [Bryocella elongata]
MRLLSSLYAKIFGWFWLTLIVGGLLVFLLTVFTGAQPLGRRWMRLTQGLYAHSAVDFYETGGDAALARYLDTLRDSSALDAHLLDEQHHDVLNRPLTPTLRWLIAASEWEHGPVFHLGRIWGAATPLEYNGHHFLFVMQAHPMQGFIDGTVAFPVLTRTLLAVLIAAGFCVILTRHIVEPVRAIQAGALRLAGGDLRTRVMPAVAPRNDELADTARAFDQMAERMELLIEKRQELLADISHELRSPLTRMSVSLELLRRGATDVLPQMEADVERMNEMIGHILLLTRLDLQPPRAHLAEVDLAAMVESIARDATFEAQREANREPKLVTVRAPQRCLVRGDAGLLRSAIENVVRNALRHTAPHTTVEIAVGRLVGGSGCEIVVTDQGPGVPEEVLPFLCDPFYRVSQVREHEHAGGGLGLSISRRVAELHGGSITLANRSNTTGLTVRIRFAY